MPASRAVKNAVRRLHRMGACLQARAWLANRKSLQSAWNQCLSSEWMMWLLAKLADRQKTPAARLKARRRVVAVLHAVMRRAFARNKLIPKTLTTSLRDLAGWSRGELAEVSEQTLFALHRIGNTYTRFSSCARAVLLVYDAVVFANRDRLIGGCVSDAMSALLNGAYLPWGGAGLFDRSVVKEIRKVHPRVPKL